jgi:hypothetical protein
MSGRSISPLLFFLEARTQCPFLFPLYLRLYLQFIVCFVAVVAQESYCEDLLFLHLLLGPKCLEFIVVPPLSHSNIRIHGCTSATSLL